MATVNNMEIWDKVCVTKDPEKNLKKIPMGNFSLTAITAMSQIKDATEIFGPYGSKWKLAWGPKYETKGIYNIGPEGSHLAIEALFIHPQGSFQETACVPCFKKGQAGLYFDDDCYKKLVTDCLTKALSRLGFNADVFLNDLKWDGNKYADKHHVPHQAEPTQQPAQSTQVTQRHTKDDLVDLGTNIPQDYKDRKDYYKSMGYRCLPVDGEDGRKIFKWWYVKGSEAEMLEGAKKDPVPPPTEMAATVVVTKQAKREEELAQEEIPF